MTSFVDHIIRKNQETTTNFVWHVVELFQSIGEHNFHPYGKCEQWFKTKRATSYKVTISLTKTQQMLSNVKTLIVRARNESEQRADTYMKTRPRS